MNQAERRRFLIEWLLDERAGSHAEGRDEATVPADAEGQRELLRALMNVRPPAPVPADILGIQDAYLAQRLAERGGAVDAAALSPIDPADPVLSRVALWQGDITRLAADAIMNAANSQMLGCFVPGHHCIDNAIHTFAGMQLRLACAQLMDAQGHEEPTGQVKVTPGFNLPARYVFHTVGPIVAGGRPGPRDRARLQSSYLSCLAAATGRGCRTLACCCLSTGVFGYPAREAAGVAVDTVLAYLTDTDRDLKVIFDVFLPSDRRIYEELLEECRTTRC